MSRRCANCKAQNSDCSEHCRVCGVPMVAPPSPKPPIVDSSGISVRQEAVLSGAGIDRVVLPEGQTVTLGRLSQNDSIAAALNAFDDVSRRHAHVTVRDGKVEIADQTSRNGTWVNDDRIARGGSRLVDLPVAIRLGHSCELRIERPA